MLRTLIVCSLFFLAGCNSQKEDGNAEPPAADLTETREQQQNYFPLTTFIKGQIYDIRQRGINPLKTTEQNNKTDSVWVKVEDLEKEFAEFLTPEIDTGNMKRLYEETNFLDASVGAYTFTYEPWPDVPVDTLAIRMWTVYVDPLTNRVTRIYIVKQPVEGEQLQLTWIPDSYTNVRRVYQKDGEYVAGDEVTIKWNFNE